MAARGPGAATPLQVLGRRKGENGAPFLAAAELEAGERLHTDYLASMMRQSVTSDWTRARENAKRRAAADFLTPQERALDAEARLGAALRAVRSDLAQQALVYVCCREVGLADTEKLCGWPVRSGKQILKVALGLLADHYGLNRTGAAWVDGWIAKGARPDAFPGEARGASHEKRSIG